MRHSIFSRQAKVHWTTQWGLQFPANHAQSHTNISFLHLPAVKTERRLSSLTLAEGKIHINTRSGILLKTIYTFWPASLFVLDLFSQLISMFLFVCFVFSRYLFHQVSPFLHSRTCFLKLTSCYLYKAVNRYLSFFYSISFSTLRARTKSAFKRTSFSILVSLCILLQQNQKMWLQLASLLCTVFVSLLYFPCEDFACVLHSSESDVHPQDFIGPLTIREIKIQDIISFMWTSYAMQHLIKVVCG